MVDDKTPQPPVAVTQEHNSVTTQDPFEVTESGSLVNLPEEPSDTEIYREIRSAPERRPTNEQL